MVEDYLIAGVVSIVLLAAFGPRSLGHTLLVLKQKLSLAIVRACGGHYRSVNCGMCHADVCWHDKHCHNCGVRFGN